jgi:hypothetical protein
MMNPTHLAGNAVAAGLLAASALSGQAQAATPTVEVVAGKPALMLGSYDLGQFGYQVDEFFISGDATSYRLPTPPTADGNWKAVPDKTAAYKTRIVVVRPMNAARFNGTVAVEWLNVTGGMDTPADWMVAHRELLRSGYAYVAVTAQKVGVDGAENARVAGGVSLKKMNPARYGSLLHPGDAYSYDIYSQAGSLLRAPNASGLLGTLVPHKVLSTGESQSAAYLTTYVNAVDPLARVYDGFLIHSRFGSSASIDGASMRESPGAMPPGVQFRADLRVPVLAFIAETDLVGPDLAGYHGARQKEGPHLRVWEVAGAAHADGYLFKGAFIDDGHRSTAELAAVFKPETATPAGKLDKPYNTGVSHHYVLQAALSALNGWVISGHAPAKTEPLALLPAPSGRPSLQVDASGLAIGGVRTPWVDVPTMHLSGVGNTAATPMAGFMAMLAGVGEPFDKAKVDKLYPGGKADYLARFTRSLDDAISRRHILPADREEILGVAALEFDAATAP